MTSCSLQFGVRSMLEQSVPKRLPWRHTAANNRKQQEAKSSPGGLLVLVLVLVPVPVLVLVLVLVPVPVPVPVPVLVLVLVLVLRPLGSLWEVSGKLLGGFWFWFRFRFWFWFWFWF